MLRDEIDSKSSAVAGRSNKAVQPARGCENGLWCEMSRPSIRSPLSLDSQEFEYLSMVRQDRRDVWWHTAVMKDHGAERVEWTRNNDRQRSYEERMRKPGVAQDGGHSLFIMTSRVPVIQEPGLMQRTIP